MTPHPDDPVELHFAPQGSLAQLNFAAVGRPLIWGALRRAGRLGTDLTVRERFRLQQQFSRRVLRHLRVKLDIRGLEQISSSDNGPYLIASLHEGIADVLCLLQLPLPMRFVARREIFTWPEVGPVITRLGHVAINPEHPLGGFRDLWRAADQIIAGGESLAIFPQGAIAGIQSDFQRGVFEVARRVGAPILPVSISGTHRIWEHPFAPTLRYGQAATLTVLPPISAAELQHGNLESIRVRTRRAMKAAALSPGTPAPRFFDPERDGYWDGYRLDIDPDFPDMARQMADHRAALLRGTA
ncbi:lysophospholipid acyltransferase family protein [Deinococcus sp.]|uniref:lysophospholipid acyltransferase family protein n=1 Tax=Deinococcus sp. TaxID=47478 RepID=UPI003B58D749